MQGYMTTLILTLNANDYANPNIKDHDYANTPIAKNVITHRRGIASPIVSPFLLTQGNKETPPSMNLEWGFWGSLGLASYDPQPRSL